jgi:diacylglycerol kinase (ATP)
VTPPSRRSIIWSFNFAIEGIVYTLRTQRNMRVHLAAAALVSLASLLLGVTRSELVSIVIVAGLVLVAELVNTAVEATVDVATDHYDPLAKVAKDVAAGAVLIASVIALIVGYLVLYEPVRDLLQVGLDHVRFAPPDITVIALAIVLLAVLALKAVSREGTWLHGGWPSGHAAVAFSAATILGYTTGSGGALAMGLFIAFLVVQSRVEAEVHTIPQSLVGAALGVILTSAVFQVFFR